MSEEIFSPCGLYCNTCLWFKGEMEPKCAGCTEVGGRPFWGSCQTYTCAQAQNVEHCGLCSDFPCKDFMARYDPREGPANSLMRAGLLAYRVKHGDREALEILEKAENYEKPS